MLYATFFTYGKVKLNKKMSKYIQNQRKVKIDLPPELKQEVIESISKEDMLKQNFGDSVLLFYQRILNQKISYYFI